MAVELQINFTEPFPEMMENPNHNVRRHSQSYAVCVSSTSDNLTTPYTRGRSFSTSAVSNCSPSSFAAHILASVNSTLKTMDEPEEHSFLDYVDGQVHETWETAKALMLGTKRLLLIHELPPDRRENQYVLSGYRFYRNHTDCLRSIFKLHNETMNIWSHLSGFIFFLFMSVYVFKSKFPDAVATDLMIFTIFCISSLLCLLCSSIYHTFICHSGRHVKSLTATLDYIGITFLITASIMVVEHFGFYCQPTPRVRYMLFSLLIGTIGTVLPFFPFFDTKRYRPLRIGLFVTMGFSSIVPLLHLISMKGFLETVWFLKPALYGGLMYCAGVTVYAKRFPEKFFPGRFDFAGMTSHAIWHMFVCLGIFFHYIGSFHFYTLRDSYGCML